jgi:hypothetical protein
MDREAPLQEHARDADLIVEVRLLLWSIVKTARH